MKQRIALYLLLVTASLLLYGCGKVGLKDPVYLPGLGNDPVLAYEGEPPSPIFKNGDIVRHKLLNNKIGIMMNSSYKYFPKLKTWYCIVDFYPSSAIRIEFSDFDNYERRYVFEYELASKVPIRWQNMGPLVVCE